MCAFSRACVVLGTVLLLAAPSVLGQNQRGPHQSVQNILHQQEQQLATAEKRQDKKYFQQKLDDNLIYVAYNGLVFTKDKILQSLNYIDVSRYSIQNTKVRPLGINAGLVTYDLLLNGSIAGHDLPKKMYASSVWVKRGGAWVLIFHQSTPAHHN